MDSKQILKQIITKGGLMSHVAKLYISDEEKSKQFLRECFEQCHVEAVVEFWGDDLVENIIINYNWELPLNSEQ